MPPKRKPKVNVKEILNNPVQDSAQINTTSKKEGFWGWMTYIGWSAIIFVLMSICFLHYDKTIAQILGDIFVEPLSSGEKHQNYHYLKGFVFPYFSTWTNKILCLISAVSALAFLKVYCDLHSHHNMSFTERLFLYYVTPIVLLISFILILCDTFHVRFTLEYTDVCIFLGLNVIICYFMIKIGIKKFLKLYGIGGILPIFFVIASGYTITSPAKISIYAFTFIYVIGCYLYLFYKKSKDGYKRIWLKVFLFTILPLLSLLNVQLVTEHKIGYWEAGLLLTKRKE
ncbi:MAG: hypothetical protein IKV03_05555 [Alphaproteobacteria bacterium]|nr:hypothetical protein [Alphaproteobacteria bacterium]